MTELPPPPRPARESKIDLLAIAMEDPMVLSSAVLVGLGLLLLLIGVLGNWHWKAAIWLSVLCSIGAFALVVISARQRRDEFPATPDEEAAPPPPKAVRLRGARTAAVAETAEQTVAKPRTRKPTSKPPAEPGGEAPAPKPRFSGLGKPKPAQPPAATPPPPQPTNVQVMPVPGSTASNVRMAPTPKPMPIARPERTPGQPPSSPPATPPTIQVGVPREPGFPVHRPADPDAPVIQVRNRYHRPDCRYVTVADDAIMTTVGAAKASNAMPCGVCRP